MAPVGERPPGELAQHVVEAVECLHCRRRILERPVGEGSLRDVDEEADAVGDVLLEGRLQRQDQRLVQSVLVEPVHRPVHAKERSPRGHELAERGRELQLHGGALSLLDEIVVADPGDDTRASGAHDLRCAGLALDDRAGVRVLAIDELPRVRADELDE